MLISFEVLNGVGQHLDHAGVPHFDELEHFRRHGQFISLALNNAGGVELSTMQEQAIVNWVRSGDRFQQTQHITVNGEQSMISREFSR